MGRIYALVVFALGCAAPGGGARADEDALKGLAQGLGFAIQLPPPAPFVVDARPGGELPWIDVFAPPPEPDAAKMTPAELLAQQRDLEAAIARHDSARRRFPPAAKALAQKRAELARAKAKKPPLEPAAPH